jgi:beta-lactam-binding protein with PASTA domain
MKKNDTQQKEKFKYFGSIGRIAVIFFIGFSLFLLVSTIILIILTKPEREVVVPDVEGKRFVEAYNSLIRKGVKPDIKFKDIADIDDGLILSQYPKKGKVVPENSKIKLLVSRSEYIIEVPNLMGKELPLALNNLKNIHRHEKTLSLGTGVISFMPSDTVTDNIVIDQSPRAGEKITPDHRINLLVSTGKTATDTVMPDVTGQYIELCYDLLRAKGLTVNEEIVMTDDSARSGLVVSQTPARGAEVKKGDACTLKINWFKLEKHPYSAYEKIEYQIPADEKAGLYEAYVNDGHSKRIRYSKNAAPGQKIVFVFRREGNAIITFRCNKKRISDTDIDVD